MLSRRFMKYTLVIASCAIVETLVYAQDVPNPVIEQQFENISEAENGETEDDSYQQQLQFYRKRPLNLNTATETDLQVFRWLTDLQIRNFIRYRSLLGKLISIYELQAIPGWDVESINLTRPFVKVSSAITIAEDAGNRIKDGEHTLLFRIAQVFEKSAGYISKDDSSSPKYTGSPQRLFFRYKYQYKNLLQYGMAGEKDAGEQFFKGAQKYGFDFYSFHLFARNIGIIRRMALGDFTVNLAQGLLTYQSLAFRKSVDVMNIKRQTEIFRPYNSPGEINFHRGVAITVGSDRFQLSGFVSYKRIDANAVTDTFTNSDNGEYVSSIINSGYHRTENEIADRYNTKQFSAGGRLQYRAKQLQLGISAINYHLSRPLHKEDAPYNKYNLQGDNFTGFSTDYAYTFRNVHVFGEIAADQKFSVAMVHGLVASLDPKVDFSLLYRNIAGDYNSLNANAFTEASQPVNERGLYTGISLRPWGMLRLDMYADLYSFPWLRYRVDRPSSGTDYLLQLTWRPNKEIELYTRFRTERKAINYTGAGLPYHETTDVPRQNWRTQVSYRLSSAVTLRTRVESVWYDKDGKYPEQGFLVYADLFYKPLMKHVALNMRLQYFETGSYDSRIYAYETDVLYSYTVPPFSGKGYRSYFNINYDLTKNISAWLRIARTVYPGQTAIGSAYDEIKSNHRTDYRFQVLFRL